MAKIDYSKAEDGMNEAVQRMRIQKLQEGKPVTSDRAAEFYGLDNAPRLAPEDPIERLLAEEAMESEIQAQKEKENRSKNQEPIESEHTEILDDTQYSEEYDEPGTTVESIPYSETILKFRPRKDITRKPVVQPDVDPTKTIAQPEELSPLIRLRKHILWLKTRGIQERYELLGTSREEIFSLRKKHNNLSPQDVDRITALNKNAEAVRQNLLKKDMKATNEELIERQKKDHRNKFHSVRDRWLKL